MNSKTGLYILLLGIASSLLTPLQGQDARATLAIADSLAAEENWDAAMYYYQRALFFAEEELSPQTWLRLSRANRALGRQQEAIDCLDAAYFSSSQAGFRNDIQFEKALFFLQAHRYYEAMAELFFLPDTGLDGDQIRKKNLYLAVAQLGVGNMEESERLFISLLNPEDKSGVSEIESMFADFKLRKPKLARTLSAIMPGAGQLYAGQSQAALNSFLLTGALLTLGALTAADYTLLEATWALPWFWRYYQGGIREAGLAAARWNASRKAVLYDALVKRIYR